MILSRSAVYALKAAIHLVEAGPEVLVRADDVAAALGVPRNYLSKILHAMGRAGLLESTRGPHGGFTLAVDPRELTLARVIEPFDDLARGSGCLLGRSRCSDADPCAAHERWRAVAEAVRRFLDETTVYDLAASGVELERVPSG